MTHKPSPHPKKPRPRKNTKRTGEFSEVEASCGRDPERSEGGSLQPKSRAQRGTSTSPCSPLHKKSARKNTKRTGEFSEAAFLTKATGLGFRVAKPWGDSERYDFIVACPAGGSPSSSGACRSSAPRSFAPAPTKSAPPTASAKAAPSTRPMTLTSSSPTSSLATSGTSSPSRPACARPCSASIPTEPNAPVSNRTAKPGTSSTAPNHRVAGSDHVGRTLLSAALGVAFDPRGDSRPRLSSRAKLGRPRCRARDQPCQSPAPKGRNRTAQGASPG